MDTVTRFTWRKQNARGSASCMRHRRGCTATAVGHYIYVIGGKNAFSLISLLDVNARTWTELRVPPYSLSLENHTANLHNDSIFVFANKPLLAPKQLELHSFDIALKEFEIVPTFGQEQPPLKLWHTADICEEANLLLFFGGFPRDTVGQLYMLDLLDFHWRRASTKGESPVGRNTHASAMVGSRLYIYGGFGSRTIFLDRLYMIDCERGRQVLTWHRISVEGLEGRARVNLVHLGRGRLMILGGTNGNVTSEILVVEVKGSRASVHKLVSEEDSSIAPSQEQSRYVISGSAPSFETEPKFVKAHGKIYAVSGQSNDGDDYYELLPA